MKKLFHPVFYFFRYLREAGLMLVLVTLVSLVWANSRWGDAYIAAWHHPFEIASGGIHFHLSLSHAINDGLMAVFFLLVGLEIKRELIGGELAVLKKAMLPALAALGGMFVPALIYRSFTAGTGYSSGWGIPMATDIAFALAVLSLAGNRVPAGLKIFLTALAIIDDLGAILVIAVFYTEELQGAYLLWALLPVGLLAWLHGRPKPSLYWFMLPAILLWYCFLQSGIHATIAGVIVAFFIPVRRSKGAPSLLEQLEHHLHAPVQLFILPLFALANTAIRFPDELAAQFLSPLSYGIAGGLLVGKPLGVLLFSYLGVRSGWCALPAQVTWRQMTAAGCLAGIGFTMSVFISLLAFENTAVQDQAKMVVLVASLLAALSGMAVLQKK